MKMSAIGTICIALWVAALASTAMAGEPLDLGCFERALHSCGQDDCCACDSECPCEQSFLGLCKRGPMWTGRVGGLVMRRSDPQALPLVTDSLVAGGNVLLDAADFDFGYRAGYEFGLVFHYPDDPRWELEARYLRIDNWRSVRGVISAPNGAVVPFATPLGFPLAPTDLTASYESVLSSFELNVRRSCLDGWVVLLAGLRIAELNDRNVAISADIGPGLATGEAGVGAINNLYGFQLGAETRIPVASWLSIEGSVKAGAFHNRAANSASIMVGANNFVFFLSSAARDDSTAMLGEATLSGVIRPNKWLALRGGYQFLCMDAMALAPRQVAVSDPLNGTALVDSLGTPYFHGAMFSMELTW